MTRGLKGQCMKYSLLVINFLVFVFGFVLFGLGIFAVSLGQLGKFINVPSLGVGVIVLGVVLIIISFFGCCGAFKENRFLLGLYFTVVLLVIVCQIGVAIGGLLYSDKLRSVIAKGWHDSSDEFKKWVEEQYECCGFYSPHDNNGTCPDGIDPSTAPGCFDTVYNDLHSRFMALVIVAVVFACVQVLGLIMSCSFCRLIHKRVVDRRDLLAESRRINNFYRDSV